MNIVLVQQIDVLAGSIVINNATQYRSMLHASRAFANVSDVDAVNNLITDVTKYSGKRPHWRASELYAAFKYPVTQFKYNHSLKLNEQGLIEDAYYGEKNSIRPDYWDSEKHICVDIKNYTVTTASGRNKLITNVITQYEKRKAFFANDDNYADVTYEVCIDVRGQDWVQSDLDEIEKAIKDQSNQAIKVYFFK